MKVFKVTKRSEENAPINGYNRKWWTCHLVECTDKRYPEEMHLNISQEQYDVLQVGDMIRIKEIKYSTKEKTWNDKVFYSNSLKLMNYEKVALPFDPSDLPFDSAAPSGSATPSESPTDEPLCD